LILAVVGCRRAEYRAERELHDPIRVVCTTGLVADMIANLGGSRVAVEALMGSGVDPHLYKATPADVRRLTAADAVFYSGLHLEGRLAELLEKLHRWKPAYAVTAGLEDLPGRLRGLQGAAGVYDPHVWFDVELWSQCAERAARQLMELDPAHAAEYRANADRYRGQLAELHLRCAAQLAEIPRDRRVLVTAHDAFGYFGAAYAVEVRGLQGISTVAEADLSEVNDLIELLAARGVKAVFVESSVPAKNIRALVEGCAARGHRVEVGGELYSDALGPAGTPTGTYLGMVEHNLATIVAALK
jgi:manganese/zinc/iron transport system substrate-binding protein